MKIILETDRLFLREFLGGDYNDLCEILQDKDVMYAYGHSLSDEEVESWYNRLIVGHYEKFGFGLWAVIHRKTNDLLGQCGLTIQEINCFMMKEIKFWLREEEMEYHVSHRALRCNYSGKME